MEHLSGSARFHEILKELGELHDRKQADYGRPTDPFANVRASEEWDVPSWVGALMRGTDKLRRLQTFAQRGELANEAVEDSFKDLAVYAIIGLVLFEETEQEWIGGPFFSRRSLSLFGDETGLLAADDDDPSDPGPDISF